MKLITILCLLFISTFTFSQNRGDQIFDESYVHEIRITCALSLPSLFDIFFEDFLTNDYTYTLAEVTIDGEVLDSVGFRVKGGLSAFDLKKPLKLDFNSFVTDQRYDGLKKLNLHQGNKDASFMRESIAYGLFRKAGVKTVRTSYANVYVNDIYEGVYTIVEQIDNNFIKNRFASDEGTLYKTGVSADLDIKFEVNNPLPFNDFVDAVNQIPTADLHEQLDKYLDVESFLRFFAIQIFITAVDGPLTVNKNYYIYYEPKSAQYVYVPWDYNLALYGYADHTLFVESTNFLFNRALSNNRLRDRYLDIYCALFDYNFVEETIFDQIETYRTLLQDHVPNDPYLSQSGDWNQGIQDIKNVISERIQVLGEELNQYITDCPDWSSPIAPNDVVINEIMASNNVESGIADPAGGHADWIELYNNTSMDIDLSDFYISNDRDVMKHWRFPAGTKILANDYLIIWADRDLDEEGLHASFKLNKSAGELVLSFENGGIIDEVDFNDQETNIGYARVPNGTGDFKKQEATFGSHNNVVSLVENEPVKDQWSVFPNLVELGQDIVIKNSTDLDVELQILDGIGRIIWRKEIKLYPGENILKTSGMPLHSGIHIIKMINKSAREQQVKKLIFY